MRDRCPDFVQRPARNWLTGAGKIVAVRHQVDARGQIRLPGSQNLSESSLSELLLLANARKRGFGGFAARRDISLRRRNINSRPRKPAGAQLLQGAVEYCGKLEWCGRRDLNPHSLSAEGF
jgi:hypothetical protein